MRLKKIMSLVLACAMALSLVTVASAADTRVYYAEDFSEYVDTDETTAIGAFNNKMSYDANANPKPTATLKDGASRLYGMYTTNSGPAGQYRDFTTNDFGSKALRQYGDGIIGSTNESYLATNRSYKYVGHLDTKWDFVEKADETIVVSYEFEANVHPGITSSLAVYAGSTHAWFTDSSDTEGTAMSVIREKHDAGTAASGTEGEEDYVAAAAPANYIVNFSDGQGGASNIASKSFPNGTSIRTAFGFSKDTDTNAYRYFAIDGARLATSNTVRDTTPFASKTVMYAFSHDMYGSMRSNLANVKIYTIKTDDFKVYAATTEDVALNTKTMRIYFSNIVSPATYTADTTAVVYADGVAMEEGTYSVGTLQNYIGDVGGEIYSYVDVTFDSLDEATTYTVEFPETITNEIGTTLAGKNVATFTTKYPDIKVNSFTVTNAAGLVADGSVQGAKVVLENTTSANKSVALIYAVYTTAGQLADVVYVNDTVAAEKTAEYEAGVKLNAAGTLKAFVWDGMTALKPYTGIQSAAITAVAE